MSRSGIFLAAALCSALLFPGALQARSSYNGYDWYQPRYMANAQAAGEQLKFLAPHFSSFFATPTGTKDITITLDNFTASRLGINLFFTVSGVTEKDAPGLLSFDTVKVPYKKDEVVSIVYADISSFELEGYADGSLWCATSIARHGAGASLCVPSKENAEQLIDALATLMGANGHVPDEDPGMQMWLIPDKEARKHPERAGCKVALVALNSPPAQAGIEENDILHTVNGAICTPDGLASAVADAARNPSGGVIQMGILRKNNPLQLDVHYPHFALDPATLSKPAPALRPHEMQPGMAAPAAAAAPAFHLGISGRAVTDTDLAATGQVKAQGVLVTHVEKGSIADQMQLQVGDVIVQMNGAEVTDAGAFAQAVRGGQAKSFRVWRKGKTLDLTIPQSM